VSSSKKRPDKIGSWGARMLGGTKRGILQGKKLRGGKNYIRLKRVNADRRQDLSCRDVNGERKRKGYREKEHTNHF